MCCGRTAPEIKKTFPHPHFIETDPLCDNGDDPALFPPSPSHRPRSSSNFSDPLPLVLSSRWSSSYLHGSCATILHRVTLFIVMSIDARSAGPPSFSLALQSPRSCSNCAHYQLRKCSRHRRFCEMALPGICLSACVLPSFSEGPLCLPFNSSPWLRSRL